MKTAHIHLLRVYIPDTDITPDTVFNWALYDEKAQLQNTSSDVVSSLPAAKRLELILPAASVRLLTLSVPSSSRAQIQKLLPFALEDKLITPPDASHTVLGRWANRQENSANKQKTVAVASADKVWLQALIAQFTQAGKNPQAAYSELQCLPERVEQEAHLYWQPTQAWWLQNQQADYIWQDAPDAALTPPQEAEVIHLWHPVDSTPPTVASSALINTQPWQWFEAKPQALAINLLEGLGHTQERTTNRIRPWRLSMALALILLCILGTRWGLDFWQKHTQSQALQAQISALFKAKMPANTPMVDPIAQMQQYANGGGTPKDAGLALLAQVSPALNSYQPLSSLNYSSQQWQVGVTVPDAAAAEALKQQIAALGVQVAISQSSPNSSPAAAPMTDDAAIAAQAAAMGIEPTAPPPAAPVAQGLGVILTISASTQNQGGTP